MEQTTNIANNAQFHHTVENQKNTWNDMNAVDEITLEKKTANYKRVPCRVLASTKHVLASRTHVCHCHRITGTCISETEAVEL